MKIFAFKLYKKFTRMLNGTNLSKHHILNKMNLYVSSKLKSDYISHYGYKLFLDKNDVSALSVYGYTNDQNIKLFEKIINNGDLCIDIGANIGAYTLVLAKLVGETGKVFSFEPDPNTFKILQKNIEINNISNVIVEQRAILDKKGTVNLLLEDYTTKITNQKSNVVIECDTIDNLFKNYEKEIQFIKIDAEGSEAKIISGMSKFLEKNKSSKFFVEYYPKFIVEAGSNPEELIDNLSKYGFKLFDTRINEGELTPADFDTLCKTYTVKHGTTDLFCIRDY